MRDLIVKDARKELKMPARRLFGKRMLSLGGLAMLTGCNITDDKSVNAMLRKMSSFNDDAQALLFDPNKLAPTYPESMITRPFPFNAFYDIDEVPEVDAVDVQARRSAALSKASASGRSTNCTRCRRKARSRATSASRAGARSANGAACASPFPRARRAPTRARSTSPSSAPTTTSTSIDMPTALHAQTLLDAHLRRRSVLPPKYGFPMKLRMPTKLGYKNPKHIVAITVTNEYPGGYWENQGYNWFGGS